ncbi:MAG: hypothetical protein Kow0089_19240 [Desulfobulbaceae bacterium]
MSKKNEERRSFLKHLVAGTAAVAGVTASGRKARATTARGVPRDDSEVLYRETDAFRRFYDSLRS